MSTNNGVFLILINVQLKERYQMPTSSFDKDFTLTTAKEIDSFCKIISQRQNAKRINKNVISKEKVASGEIKIKTMLPNLD